MTGDYLFVKLDETADPLDRLFLALENTVGVIAETEGLTVHPRTGISGPNLDHSAIDIQHPDGHDVLTVAITVERAQPTEGPE